MPSGPGAADAQGVWQFGESDNADGTFSGLMALLTSRLTTQYAADRARLTELELNPRSVRSASAAIAFPITTAALITGWDTAITTDTRLAYAAGRWTVGAGMAGLYHVHCSVSPASTSGAQSLFCYKNATALLEARSFAVTGTGSVTALIDDDIDLVAGDVIDFRTLGAPANAGVAAPMDNRASIRRLGPT